MEIKASSEKLLNIDLVRRRFLKVAFSGSHGADGEDLGAGLLYYAMAKAVRARVCVCIGSGGGFVPGLMAQAQNDCGYAANCCTYLVDAVLPELAFGSPLQSGGWLANGNDLLNQYPQMRVVRLLSVDAAKLFARHGIEIDYLHIDGDHSKSGVISDLESYAPILSSGAIITLHDTSKKPVIEAILNFIESNPSFEKLSFSEIGAGAVILRAPSAPEGYALDKATPRRVDIDADAIKSAEEEGVAAIRFERWRYLATDAYRMRYVVAGEWVDQPEATVVEIGGYPNSVIRQLRQARRLIAVEPYAPDDYVEEMQAIGRDHGVDVTVIQKRLEHAALLPEHIGPFNLLALGLDFTSASDSSESYASNVEALYAMLASSGRFAVEWPDAVHTGELWAKLQDWLDAQIKHRISLNLAEDPVGIDFHVRDKRAVRNVVMGTPGEAQSLSSTRPKIKEFGAALFARNENKSYIGKPILRLGETVEFVTGRDSQKYLGFGWSRLEPKFTLALGDESDIVVQWAENEIDLIRQAKKIMLSLTLKPVVAPHETQGRKIEIWLGETLLFDERLAVDTALKLPISTSSLADGHENIFRIIHRDRLCPRDFRKNSTDARLLSIGLVDMRFDIMDLEESIKKPADLK